METAMTLTLNVTGWDTTWGEDEQDGGPNTEAVKLLLKITNFTILVVLMLSMGCTIDLKEFKDTFRHPVGFLVGMVCQFVVMPLAAFCLALAFGLEAAGALSVLLVGCCPGGTLSNLFTFWTNGDVCLSVSMTAVSTTVAIGMMPLNLLIYSRVWTDEKAVIPYASIAITLVVILIPLGCGVFLRWWKKEWMACITRIGIVVSVLLIISTFIITGIMNPTTLLAKWQLWVCAACLPLLGYSIGYGLARILRQSHRKCRTIAFETGSQNASVALTITALTFADSPYFYEMLFYPSLYATFIYVDSLPIILIYKLYSYYSKRYTSLRTKDFQEKSCDDDYDDDDGDISENQKMSYMDIMNSGSSDIKQRVNVD